jgi:monoamine oxidase
MPEGSVGEFDYVIFTIPLTAMRKVLFFPSLLDLKTEALREAFYVDAGKVLFLCNERFWERQGITGGATNTDLVIQSIFYPQDDPHSQQDALGTDINCIPYRSGVLTATYNIGNDATRLGNMKTFHFQMLKTMVERVHGLPEDYLDKVVTDHITVNWNRNEWITGGFINPLPGQSARFGFGLSRPDFDNRLYFAGEAVTPPHGWIQAALRSAMIAANALAYYLKTFGYR